MSECALWQTAICGYSRVNCSAIDIGHFSCKKKKRLIWKIYEFNLNEIFPEVFENKIRTRKLSSHCCVLFCVFQLLFTSLTDRSQIKFNLRLTQTALIYFRSQLDWKHLHGHKDSTGLPYWKIKRIINSNVLRTCCNFTIAAGNFQSLSTTHISEAKI